jgi:general L-amino acid transport system permease protein
MANAHPPLSLTSRSAIGWWLREHVWPSKFHVVLSIATLALLVPLIGKIVNWAVVNAVFVSTGPDSCKDAIGACWAVIAEKHRVILFGLYPYDEQWRPTVAVAIYLVAVVVTLTPRCWSLRFLGALWAVAATAIGVLMYGGVGALRVVPTTEWGGLALTMIMFTGTVIMGFPLAVLLALGRRSHLTLLRSVSVVLIETLRGVPLITILFVAVNVFPLFLPAGTSIDKLLRVTIGIAIFFACYQAETIRGGLQAVPSGQYEAAAALGLRYWQMTGRIILPQALRIAFPAIMNHVIAALKNTSFVMIIGLFDILTATTAVMQDPIWRKYYVEAYTFVGFVYFAFGFALSIYARVMERRMNKGYVS